MGIGVIDQILDLARWAPSGDNVQPWRFEVLGERQLLVRGLDTAHTRADCVYDLDGHPTQVSLGALLETLSIAATDFGLRADIVRSGAGADDTEPVFSVTLVPDDSVARSPLVESIPRRSVQRRRFSTRALTAEQKRELEVALLPGYRLRWFEGLPRRWALARLLFGSAKIRLTIEEAYRVHRDIIAWGRRYSPDRVPDRSLGADPVALLLMRWAMADWKRVQFLNRYLAGTWLPRLQMDLMPGLLCAAHVAIVRERPPQSIDDYVEAGRCMQRFWLTATRLGLQHQPEITPLIFARYARENRPFSTSQQAIELARRVRAGAERIVGDDLSHAVWLARIGHAPGAVSRSQRRSRRELTLLSPARAAVIGAGVSHATSTELK